MSSINPLQVEELGKVQRTSTVNACILASHPILWIPFVLLWTFSISTCLFQSARGCGRTICTFVQGQGEYFWFLTRCHFWNESRSLSPADPRSCIPAHMPVVSTQPIVFRGKLSPLCITLCLSTVTRMMYPCCPFTPSCSSARSCPAVQSPVPLATEHTELQLQGLPFIPIPSQRQAGHVPNPGLTVGIISSTDRTSGSHSLSPGTLHTSLLLTARPERATSDQSL